MILESDEHPWQLIDNVCSPGGTTIEGVTSLQADGFEAAVHNAVDKALDKDKNYKIKARFWVTPFTELFSKVFIKILLNY